MNKVENLFQLIEMKLDDIRDIIANLWNEIDEIR